MLAGCEDALGTSPPHAAPSNPSAEGGDTRVELTWGAVTDATRYVILWDNNPGPATFDNVINDIEGTSYVHEGLTNLTPYHYRIAAETSGGRGPESNPVVAIPGPVPASVEWTAVTTQNPGHTIYFAPAEGATLYRVYFGATEAQLAGRRPLASFEEAQGSPHVRSSINQLSAVYYRVIAMNGPRIGSGGPVAISPTNVISQHNLPVAGAAFGRVNADDCLDLPTAVGGATGQGCGTYTARVLADVGLADLIASPRVLGDARLADFNGDGFEDLFSNTNSLATETGSIALLHVNQGNGNFQTSSSVSSLAIGGVRRHVTRRRFRQ